MVSLRWLGTTLERAQDAPDLVSSQNDRPALWTLGPQDAAEPGEIHFEDVPIDEQ